MDGSIIGALIGMGFLTVVNIAVVSYSYGKMAQSVHDLSRRVLVLEGKNINKGG